LGRLVEVIAGQSFDEFLAERIFEPLGMIDTAFIVPDEKWARFAAVYRATDEGGMERIDDESQSCFLNRGVVPYGGQGLVSTASDYMRFALMLLNGGELEGVRVLGRKTVDLMMSNHLGPEYGPQPLASVEAALQSNAQGVGFGLTGAVITDPALSSVLGSTGNFTWLGAASTYFWVDRKEQLVGIALTQLRPSNTYPIWAEMRILTYQAIID
jgi:CubicO group peptidase (beta-lactamase class C family)